MNYPASKIDSIQLLRFLAALAVVGVHLPLINAGGFGVDIFFFISGFIISYVTIRGRDHFLLKRIIRVVPIYWLLTFGVFGLAAIAPTLLNNTTADLIHLAKSLFFVPFDKNGSGLFPVLFVGWTLNYEMFFYGLFWVAMMISHKNRELIAGALLVAVFLTANLFPAGSIIAQFYGHSILFEFIFGMLFRLVWTHINEREPQKVYATSVFASVFFILMVGYAALSAPHYLTDTGEFIGRFERAWVWGVPSALFCIAVMTLFSKVKIPALLILLGDASYSLYLIHAYPIQGMDKLFGVFDRGPLIGWIASLAAVTMVIIISIIFFKIIEKPLTEYLRKKVIQ